MEKMIAFCGLICSVYIATKTNNEDMKEKLAKEYSTDMFQFETDDMVCEGCHSLKGANKKMCIECPMRKCGTDKNVSHCGECSEYPCKHIEASVPTGSDNCKVLDELAKR